MATAQKSAAPVRLAHLIAADTIAIRPVKWLWDERIALGTLCLMGGREGVGKSLLTYTLAEQITRGELPGIYSGVPKSVIVAATEDSWEQTIVPRLLGAGADLTRIYQLSMVASDGDTTLTLPVDQKELQRVTVESGAALIILDPL